MSTNCVRCVKNPRDINKPGSLLCRQCAAEEWDEVVRRTIAQFPAVQTFIDTYKATARAGKGVFEGQLVRTIKDVMEGSLSMIADAKEDASVAEILQAMPLNLEEDMLMAFRFAYYCKAAPLIPDALYDQAEREFINRPEVEDTPLMQPGSDNEGDYPRRIKALWLYLFAAREDRRPKDGPGALASAKPSPSKPPAKGKTAKPAPEAPLTGELF